MQSDVIKCPNKLLKETRFNFRKSGRHTLVYLYFTLRGTFLIRYAVSPPKSILSLDTVEPRDTRLFKKKRERDMKRCEKEESERKANRRNWIPLMAVRDRESWLSQSLRNPNKVWSQIALAIGVSLDDLPWTTFEICR